MHARIPQWHELGEALRMHACNPQRQEHGLFLGPRKGAVSPPLGVASHSCLDHTLLPGIMNAHERTLFPWCVHV
jgi:hypothetical protein